MVSKVLGRTVELIGRRWQRLAPAALALGLLNALLNLLTGAAAERAVAAPDRLSPGLAWAILAAFVVAVVVGAATGALMLVLVADADRRGDPDVNDALDLVLRRLGAILGLVVVAFLLIFAGFLLLVLPGVWVAVALVPSLPILLLEDRGVGDALGESFRRIRGSWWRTFIVVLVVAIFNSVVVLPVATLTGVARFTADVVVAAVVGVVQATVLYSIYREVTDRAAA